MNFYPYNSPIILTDAIFLAYGGLTGSSTQAQRSASYLLAEETVWSDLNTFLLPTTVTGTFLYPNLTNAILLDYSYVNTIYLTKFKDFNGTELQSVTGMGNDYISLRDPGLGIMEFANYGACGWGVPYSVDVVYNAGLPSGTSYHPNILLALSTYAQIIMNEIIGFGNESSGDIGVKEFRNQQYYETRVALIRTTFGTSAKGQFIHKLLGRYRKYRRVGM